MKLKKILQITFIVCSLTVLSTPNVLAALPVAKVTTAIITEEEPSEHAKSLLIRLFEIKNMDKTTLTNSDKKALRKELKGMKKEMKSADGLDKRVYLSVGAIIIIILLILLLR